MTTYGQKEWSVYGKIINQESQNPLSGITITNLRNGHVVATNDAGDFYLRAAEGDLLQMSGVGFGEKTIAWNKELGNFTYGLKQEAIALGALVVTDKKSQTIEQELKAFLDNPTNAATMKRDIMGNLVSMSAAGGQGGGAGISIDALYDLFSKEGKMNRKVAELEYQDLKKYYVELRISKQKISNITSLKGFDLDQFMDYIDPSDEFVLSATDYDLTYYILQKLKEYRKVGVLSNQ